MPATADQLPFVRSQAARTGQRLWRKMVLPVGKVEHPEHGELHFTADRLRELRESFLSGALDQVPFVLVNDDNRHSSDPERRRGEVKGLELADDGLYAVVETTDRGTHLLADDPNLAVSVRLKRPDVGPFKGREVLAHLAGTHDPVWKNSGPWEAVDASDDTEVRDFSDRGCYSLASMADTETTEQDQKDTTDALSAPEVGKVRQFLQSLGNRKEADEPDEPDPAIAELLDSLDTDPADEREPVALSNENAETIELTKRVERAEVRAGTAELANRLSGYLDEGVPPTLINAAKAQLLGESDEHKAIAIDFANGREPAAAKALFAVLDGAKGTIDFSEVGSSESSEQTERDRARELGKKI